MPRKTSSLVVTHVMLLNGEETARIGGQGRMNAVKDVELQNGNTVPGDTATAVIVGSITKK